MSKSDVMVAREECLDLAEEIASFIETKIKSPSQRDLTLIYGALALLIESFEKAAEEMGIGFEKLEQEEGLQ